MGVMENRTAIASLVRWEAGVVLLGMRTLGLRSDCLDSVQIRPGWLAMIPTFAK
jgi:hypothetical protein